MAKDFSAAINEIMPLVDDGDKSTPFIITRNKDADWHVLYPYPAESTDGLLQKLKEIDPYAEPFTGADFSKGSFPYVYDKALCSRLDAEIRAGVKSGNYAAPEDYKEIRAMYNFFEVSIGEFSQTVTDYLTTLDKPLAELAEMCPYKMATDNKDWYFNEDLAFDAIHYIENEVSVMIQKQPQAEIRPEPRIIDGYAYTETQRVRIGKISFIFAECPEAPYPYLVCKSDGAYYDHSAFSDYLSAVSEFAGRQKTHVNTLAAAREERRQHGVDGTVFTAEHCLPDSGNADFMGKPVIVKASELSPEFRCASSQILLCTHGSGALPGKNGRTVFGTELYSGEIVCYGRYQIEGVADEAILPEWAKVKLETMRGSDPPQQKKSSQSHVTPQKTAPPTLLDELNDAKAEVAAHNAASKDKAQMKKCADREI